MPWNKGDPEWSRRMKERWTDPAFRDKALKGLATKPPFRDTKIERKLQRALRFSGLKFETHVYVGHVTKIDIAFPSLKVGVFVDGCYFHKCPECGFGAGKPQDTRINAVLASEGWLVLRYWGHEVNDFLRRQEIVKDIQSIVQLKVANRAAGRWLE